MVIAYQSRNFVHSHMNLSIARNHDAPNPPITMNSKSNTLRSELPLMTLKRYAGANRHVLCHRYRPPIESILVG